MKRYTLVLAMVLCLSGCGLTESTYLDISPTQLDAIAARLGTSVEILFTRDRDLLKTELSESLGLRVDALEIPSVADLREGLGLGEGDALNPEALAMALKTQGLVAVIEPATEAALKDGIDGALKDPSTKGLIQMALLGGGTLLAGALGLRGRRKRKKAEEEVAT